MYTVELYRRIRQACHIDGMSIRQAARIFGIHRQTINKMLEHPVPPGYRRRRMMKRPKLGAFTGTIDQILEEDKTCPVKQRHTAKRIFDRLRQEHGYDGGYTIVKDYVRERRHRHQEVFIPLSHRPGHCQADFGEAVVRIAGVESKAHFMAFHLPHSDGCFVKAYPAETTEAFCDGHNAAFQFFGGVPLSILYDNTTLAVARILKDSTRERTRIFSELQSHYLFKDVFGRPGRGNDKGNVEGLIGFARRNFMVPIPKYDSYDAFNKHLEEQCRKRQEYRLRGHSRTIGELLEEDKKVFLPLPNYFYDACDKKSRRVNSFARVRYKNNEYSVPTAYGHQMVMIRGYVQEVAISYQDKVIARHARSYGKEEMIEDPRHYLSLLERKPRALDQASAVVDWDLPEAFTKLRERLEARKGKAGKREYIRILRLMETFRLEEVHEAVKQGLRLGACSLEAIKHLVLCHIEQRPPRLNLLDYPHLPHVHVAVTCATDYMGLLKEVRP